MKKSIQYEVEEWARSTGNNAPLAWLYSHLDALLATVPNLCPEYDDPCEATEESPEDAGAQYAVEQSAIRQRAEDQIRTLEDVVAEYERQIHQRDTTINALYERLEKPGQHPS